MTRTLRYILSILAGMVVFTGCDLIEFHPYDVNVKYRNINREGIARIEERCRDKDTIRFIWMGDTQRWYDETDKFVRHVNQRNDIDFVMHGGDISDFGMNREFDWVHEDMKRLNVPYVALIGNHDLLGNGLDVYEKMYGALNFTFVAGKTKIVCLNTNALEFDYSNPVPDFNYIREEINDLDKRQYDQTIVTMHANPFGEQFNNNVAYLFHDQLTKMKNLRFCLHAHAHRLMENDFFDDGIIYYGCAAMKDRNYMVFTVTPDDYSYEIVYF